MSIVKKSEQDIHDLLQTPIIHEGRKNKYAEVLTPLKFIDEILDAIPSSAYKEPSWKWLDPAAGTGRFFLALYLRLLKGLEKAIPSLEKRKSHIIENMLVMVEYNKKNVTLLKELFGKKAKIIHGDFLTQDFENASFNGILGNPPFQMSKKENYKGSVGNRVLWPSFIKRVLENGLLKPDGYFGFITPSSWRRPHHPLYKVMVQDNHLKYLHIFNKKAGLKELGVQTRFDVYVIQKVKSSKPSKIVDELGKPHELDLASWPFLPNYAYGSFRKIMVPEEKGLTILFDSSCYDARKLKGKKTKKHHIPVVHNITRKGLGLKYGKDKCASLHKPKLLLNFNEKQYPVVDSLGNYGMSQLTFGIPIQNKKDGEQWKKVIESPFFQEILEASKWSSFQTDYRMFSYFSKNRRLYQ